MDTRMIKPKNVRLDFGDQRQIQALFEFPTGLILWYSPKEDLIARFKEAAQQAAYATILERWTHRFGTFWLRISLGSRGGGKEIVSAKHALHMYRDQVERFLGWLRYIDARACGNDLSNVIAACEDVLQVLDKEVKKL